MNADSTWTYTPEYRRFVPLAAGFALFYGAGVPFLFFWLVSSFKQYGEEGDKVVEDALGWMCTFKPIASLL